MDYFWKAASGGCSSTGWNCIEDIITPTTYNAVTPMAFTAGTTYYILLDPESTGSITQTFNLVCPPCISTTPFGSATAVCSGTPTTITTCNYAYEYATVTLPTGGINYTFASSVGSDWLVLTDVSNNVITTGTGSVNYTPGVATTVRLHVWLNSSCGTASICRTTTVNCCQDLGRSIFCIGFTRCHLPRLQHHPKCWWRLFSPGANWYWYANGCASTFIGTGSSISVAPTSTTTYYVRAEGGCSTTGCAGTTVTVNTPSVGGTVSPATQTICASEGYTNGFIYHTLSGHTGSVVQWEYATPGGGFVGWARRQHNST